MITSLLIGALVGVILALIPGPVGVATMRLSLNKGINHSSWFAFASGIMDMLFCIAAIFTTSAFIEVIKSFSEDYPLLILILQLSVIATILVFGIFQIKQKNKIVKEISFDDLSARGKIYHYLTNRGPFLLGIGVALTNIASPTFLPSLAYVTMILHKFSIIYNSAFDNFIFSVGFGVGNFIWLYLIARVLIHYKDKMSDEFLVKLHKVAGFTLIGFGTILGYRVLTFTKWPEVLRIVFAF